MLHCFTNRSVNHFHILFFVCLLVMNIGLAKAENKTVLNKQQQKIIPLAPHIVELLFDIGAGEQIIATGSFADFPEQAQSLPRVGDHSRLQIEKILQLKPDLVIAWKSGNPLDDLARLEQFGIPVIYSDPKTLEDVSADIRMLGKLTGREEIATALANNYLTQLTNIRNKYSSLDTVSAFVEIWPAPMQTIAGNAWPQQHLAICGASNIFANIQEDYPSVSLEQVVSKMPQIIIQPTSAQQLESRLFDWQRFTFIPAVKNEFILRPDADKLYRMTTRVLIEIESMCEHIQQARQFYLKP